MDEDFLSRRLDERKAVDAFRTLRKGGDLADYCSNDYLGIVKNRLIEKSISDSPYAHGSTGSRLLSGNYALIEVTEQEIARFHDSPAALIFNSGYDANFGLLSCIARRGDMILYDKLSHASIRDGIRQSFADAFAFTHNNLADLEKKLQKLKGNCFVVTESVFSMDGDQAPIREIAVLCEWYGAHLIVDEAHATGVLGKRGEGLIQTLQLQHRCLARVITFGKALGCHGAVILGSQALRHYLINFCRPFIYSTSLPPSLVASIRTSYKIFPGLHQERESIKNLITLFDQPGFKKSNTQIQCFILPGNEKVKEAALLLQKHKLDARAILYPTVPLGEERLRITLHSFNTVDETKNLISILAGNNSDHITKQLPD